MIYRGYKNDIIDRIENVLSLGGLSADMFECAHPSGMDQLSWYKVASDTDTAGIINVPFNISHYIGRTLPRYELKEFFENAMECSKKVIDAFLDRREPCFKHKTPIVTICGSRKFESVMLATKRKLEREFTIVHMPNFSFTSTEFEYDFTDEMFEKLHEMHYKKMLESDYIYIVDVHEYIGKDTQREIDYAVDHNIPVKYFSSDDNRVTTEEIQSFVFPHTVDVPAHEMSNKRLIDEVERRIDAGAMEINVTLIEK